jgi:acetyl-CoA acetyltransferase
MFDGAIVGIGEARLGKRPGWSAVELQAEASLAALQDAGLAPSDVDGVFNLGPYSTPSLMFALTLSEYLGIRPSVEASIDAGGMVSMLLMVADALHSVRAGLCQVALCTFGEPAATGRIAAGRGWTNTSAQTEFETPVGVIGAVVPYAMLAARHMSEFGTTSDDFYEFAASARRHAGLNENAVRHAPLTYEEYASSRMISTPFRVHDCSSIVDGAGALVITSLPRAADLPNRPVPVLGFAAYAAYRDVTQFPGFDELRIAQIGAEACARAGIALTDVNVALIHDAFTFSVLLYLEELGFCARGDAGEYARNGNIDLGSKCPVNTHGGLLSQGHVGGILHLVEAVRQLRGDAGARQVPQAEIAMVAGGGGIFSVNGVMILARA